MLDQSWQQKSALYDFRRPRFHPGATTDSEKKERKSLRTSVDVPGFISQLSLCIPLSAALRLLWPLKYLSQTLLEFYSVLFDAKSCLIGKKKTADTRTQIKRKKKTAGDSSAGVEVAWPEPKISSESGGPLQPGPCASCQLWCTSFNTFTCSV